MTIPDMFGMAWNRDIKQWYCEYLKQATEEAVVSEMINKDPKKTPSPHMVISIVNERLGIKQGNY